MPDDQRSPPPPTLLERLRSLRFLGLRREQQVLSGESQPDPAEFADDLAPSRPLWEITIDAKNYPCQEWSTVEEGRVLERRYDVGFIGGVGVFSEAARTRPDQAYAGVNVDLSTYPYIRLLPRRISTTLTDTRGRDPTYFLVAEDSGAAEYVYVLSGRYAKKVGISDNLLKSSKDFGATAVVGRPVLFEGAWRVPLGDNVDWVTLSTVAVGAAADTWTNAPGGAGNLRATHFAVMMQEGTAQIWRSHNANETPTAGDESNRVSGSADASAFGSSFEVGDDSLPITDLLSIGGKLMVMKPDAPWRFSNDGGGNAFPIMDFVGKVQFLSGYAGEDGANSGSHGPWAYWTHSSGLWRIFGDQATPVDPMSNPRFSGLNFDSHADSGPVSGLTLAYYGRWLSAVAYGRWMYATEASSGVWVGYIMEDGSIRWLSNVFSAQGTGLTAINRVGIVPTSSAPILYVLDDAGILYRIDLEEDGSVRGVTATGTNHGGDDEVSLVIAPETNFGESEKLKQIRMMWVNTDDMAAALSIRCLVYRDRSTTPTRIGSDVTSGGKQEVSTTPGSSDTFTDCHPALELDTGTFDEANEDPRIRSWGIRAVTPHVYRAVIPLDAVALRGGPLGVKDALTTLRNLKSGASVAVREGGFNATFTGYITGLREKTELRNGVPTHLLEVTIERFVL